MNTPHKLNEAFAAFFEDWARERLEPSKQGLFLTTTFEHESCMRRRRETAGLTLGTYEMKAFHHLYNKISRRLVGTNYNRPKKRSRLPSVACFLDSEGTKFWRSSGDAKNIHQHSIWIVERSDMFALKEALDPMGPCREFFRKLGFDAIDVRDVGCGDDDLSYVVKYASKLIGFDTRELKLGAGFEIYPLGARAID